MNRLSLRLILALLTFGIGVSLTIMGKRYDTSIKMEPASNGLGSKHVLSIPIITEHTPSKDSMSLSAELQHIDRVYQERCQIPEDLGDNNPTIIKLQEFKSCNDDWAKARLEAIEEEIRQHLTRL